jgi:hypothetical protein
MSGPSFVSKLSVDYAFPAYLSLLFSLCHKIAIIRFPVIYTSPDQCGGSFNVIINKALVLSYKRNLEIYKIGKCMF